jgi:hypothetical protein
VDNDVYFETTACRDFRFIDSTIEAQVLSLSLQGSCRVVKQEFSSLGLMLQLAREIIDNRTWEIVIAAAM